MAEHPLTPWYQTSASSANQTSGRTQAQKMSTVNQPSPGYNILPSRSIDNDDSIEAFLCNLKRPSGHFLPLFKEYGIVTTADLNALCRMEDYWNEVERHFINKGLKPFEWLVVQEGLRTRASTLT
ncbi:hypothetical protein PHLCEN_2v11556 [Hermanssonia centrifuga]|uniref:Uncharacterized protein n=1 Tax=Hermanssonia centrifuga TaxID=98765 RepID=A0A2R6NJN2_9APHY|nr:hypothetical protein PHLCEN_2v11556 [Hermanssonia centrifuga]